MSSCGRWRLLAIAQLVVVACSSSTDPEPAPLVSYTVTFAADWSAQTHPVDIPPNPHFSGLIGGTHSASVGFWSVGTNASPGIKSMAETGSKSPLDAEVQDAIAAGTAGMLISGGGINPSPDSVSVTLQVSTDFPLVTLVSMVAPSPDWFVGVAGLNLYEGGAWVDEKVVELWPYDAGTDSGPSYASPNQPTNPAEPVSRIMSPPLGNGARVGTFTFRRDDTPTAASLRGKP